MRRRKPEPERQPRPPEWRAEITQVGRFTFRVTITNGRGVMHGIDDGWGVSPFFKLGKRRAERFAVRRIAYLKRRDANDTLWKSEAYEIH